MIMIPCVLKKEKVVETKNIAHSGIMVIISPDTFVCTQRFKEFISLALNP